MTIYEASDYKVFLRRWVESRPNGGRGEYRRMAQVLGISTTMISQVVNGDKHFSMEIGNDLCDYLALNEKESEHLLLLIEYARAGSHRYQQRLKARIEEARARASAIDERSKRDRDLSETESAIYYSNWSYTGMVHLVATNESYDIDSLAARMQIPRSHVAKILSFLLEIGVLTEKDGRLGIGAQRTHLTHNSPLVTKMHQNWRLQGFNKMDYGLEKNLFYTAPMSLSEETAAQVQKELRDTIVRILEWVGPSPSEVVRCLNIDFFEY